MSELRNILKAPEINQKIVCISNDYILSAQISSCFNKPNIYFAVLEPPRSLHKYWANEFIMLNNVIAKIQPQVVIFVKVDSVRVDLIKKQLRMDESRYLYIDDNDQLNKFMLKYKSSSKGVIRCPENRILVANALLEAKRNKCQLVIDAKSKYIIKKGITQKHLVISDSDSDLLPVTLANYCFSINADLQFFNYQLPYSPREIYSILEDTRGNKKRNISAQEKLQNIKSILTLKVDNIDKYKFATFFTDDFPYGHLFPEIPTTHIYSKLLSSHFIASSIVYPFIQVQSAVLVDTGFFSDSETDAIKELLLSKEVILKELRDDRFSNLDLDNTIQFYPYDFLFICSHGGFGDGIRFKIKFFDKNNCDHIIVIDIIDSFTPTNKGVGDDRIIDVKTFYEFVELDGKPWYEKEYKNGSSKTVVEDFLAIERGKWDVLERSNIKMKFCNVIATKDTMGPYFPMIHSISDPKSTPFVFNNACISNYTLAVDFVFAGSIFYIGTVKSVGIISAVEVAKKYFDKTINQGKTLALSLWESQYNSGVSPTDAVYTCVGCHFLKFSFFLNQGNKQRLKERIKLGGQMRLSRTHYETLEDSVKERHKDAIEFLHQEYIKIS